VGNIKRSNRSQRGGARRKGTNMFGHSAKTATEIKKEKHLTPPEKRLKTKEPRGNRAVLPKWIKTPSNPLEGRLFSIPKELQAREGAGSR